MMILPRSHPPPLFLGLAARYRPTRVVIRGGWCSSSREGFVIVTVISEVRSGPGTPDTFNRKLDNHHKRL